MSYHGFQGEFDLEPCGRLRGLSLRVLSVLQSARPPQCSLADLLFISQYKQSVTQVCIPVWVWMEEVAVRRHLAASSFRIAVRLPRIFLFLSVLRPRPPPSFQSCLTSLSPSLPQGSEEVS